MQRLFVCAKDSVVMVYAGVDMEMQDASAEIDTSIVVATCSRVGLLRDALRSLEDEAVALGARCEIVVVDDGSTDGTAAFLKAWELEARVPTRVVAGPCVGVAAARNAGSAMARGTWIASFDDDQIALPGWLRALRATSETTGAAVVGGTLHLQLPQGVVVESLGPRVRNLLGEHEPWREVHVYESGVLPATNNVLLRRDVFEALGGYDVAFTEGAEDKEFFARVRAAGHALWFQPAARALHVTPAWRLELANLRWTSLRVGAGDARLDGGGGSRMVRAALRMVVAAVRDVPQCFFARLVSSRRVQMDALCSLWYTSGYVRAVVALRNGNGAGFLRSLNFRERNGERRE